MKLKLYKHPFSIGCLCISNFTGMEGKIHWHPLYTNGKKIQDPPPWGDAKKAEPPAAGRPPPENVFLNYPFLPFFAMKIFSPKIFSTINILYGELFISLPA